MKRRTLLPCWCVRLVAGGETHEVVQTGVCNWEKAEARIRRYFIAERKQIVDRFLSMERMSEQQAKVWLEVADRGEAKEKCSECGVYPPDHQRRLRRLSRVQGGPSVNDNDSIYVPDLEWVVRPERAAAYLRVLAARAKRDSERVGCSGSAIRFEYAAEARNLEAIAKMLEPKP